MDDELDLTAPFRAQDFTATGRPRSALLRGPFRQLVQGVWMHVDHVDRWSLMRAALLIHPDGAFLSHLSAATLLGLPVPEPAFVHVTVKKERDRRFRPEIKPHAIDRRRHLTTRQRMPVTDSTATFIDCAGWLSLVDLVVLGDAIVRRGAPNAASLRTACAASGDYYAGLARTAAAFVRDGVDSPMETRLRMLIVLGGMPEPLVDHRLYWPDGSLRRRFDLYYARERLVVEYDGRQHADNPAQWRTDLWRREELDDQDVRILVFTATDLFRTPGQTLERIRRVLVSRGMPRVPAIDASWRDHFAA